MRFFAQHDRRWISLQQSIGDQHLGLMVGDRHQITGPLLLYLPLRQRLETWGDHLGRDLLHEPEDLISSHAPEPTASPARMRRTQDAPRGLTKTR